MTKNFEDRLAALEKWVAKKERDKAKRRRKRKLERRVEEAAARKRAQDLAW